MISSPESAPPATRSASRASISLEIRLDGISAGLRSGTWPLLDAGLAVVVDMVLPWAFAPQV
ncbi:MAG: hypothetical protein NVS2B6_07570 [Thermoleophilaceae bacterium]